ncbi:MAG: hypothetical protein J6I76_01025 [Oribacterium sp.]|nr:hypothetical protein [Oribacterium sp.]
MRSTKIPFITLVLVVLMSIVSLADVQKYHFNDGIDTFYSQEGGLWVQGKGWTYTKPDGTEAIGWTIIDGDYHYFNENGWMYRDTYTPDGYYVDSNGVWVENITAQTQNTGSDVNESQIQQTNVLTKDGIYHVHQYGGMTIQGNQLSIIAKFLYKKSYRYDEKTSDIDYGFYTFELDPNAAFYIIDERGMVKTTFADFLNHRMSTTIEVSNGKVISITSEY